MDIDPMDLVETDDAQKETDRARQDRKKSQLNTAVAISVALMATFIGVEPDRQIFQVESAQD